MPTHRHRHMHTHNTHAHTHTHTNTLAACACFGQFDGLQADKVEAARRRVKSALLAAACYLARTEDRKLPSQADALLAQQAMAMYRQCANSAAAETALSHATPNARDTILAVILEFDIALTTNNDAQLKVCCTCSCKSRAQRMRE